VELPTCLITLQREKTSLGYFSYQRFVNVAGQRTDEIAMNPSYFAIKEIKDTLSTLAHEMVLLRQAHFGSPSRRRYHNAQWADTMISIGFMPSHPGAPGGRTTGEHMDHYVIAGGPFDKSADRLITSAYKISWYDRLIPRIPTRLIQDLSPSLQPDPAAIPLSVSENPAPIDVELRESKPTRIKYTCPDCGINVRGKPEQLQCPRCGYANPFLQALPSYRPSEGCCSLGSS
jgi:ribosomal protein S27AE